MTRSLAHTKLVCMNRERLRQAVADAMEQAPGSIRALARAAGVSHVMLIQVRDGLRPASRGVGEGVAAALEGWSDELAGLARAVREALEADPPPEGE